ncbi:MAG: APC family permease [Clostridia bacterium]|nr:APC family permease [Clostridia bacterium]
MAEKKIIKVDGTPAEKKKIQRPDGSAVTIKPAVSNKDKSDATKYRVCAAVLWLAAIAFEVLAVLIYCGKVTFTFMPTMAQIIAALVLDLICVSAGSLLWKKANRIDPASEKNPVKFWLWNNMGLIVTAFAFVPFVVIALSDKNADKQTKTVAVVVAIIALLIGSLFGIDWNPVSIEEKEAAMETLDGYVVYWSPYGTVYHLDPDCGHLNHTDTLTEGSVEQAIEANRTRLCKTCSNKFNIEIVVDETTTRSIDENGLRILDDEAVDQAPVESLNIVDAA